MARTTNGPFWGSAPRTDGSERSPSARRSSLSWSTKSAAADSRATKTLIDMLEDNETCPLDTELGGTHLPGRETRHCTSESRALATLEHIRRNSLGVSRGSANNPWTLRSGGREPIPAGPSPQPDGMVMAWFKTYVANEPPETGGCWRAAAEAAAA